MINLVIIGKPNVGKSELFNRLIGNNKSLVFDEPGITRDRIYSKFVLSGKIFFLIDTGGLFKRITNFDKSVYIQILKSIGESNIILFVIDCSKTLTIYDYKIIYFLKRLKKNVIFICNKVDLINDYYSNFFFNIGFGEPFFISAKYGYGIKNLKSKLLKFFFIKVNKKKSDLINFNSYITVSVIGRPNVGKSSLINKMLKCSRQIVSNFSGTTLDTVFNFFKFNNKNYVFVDTPGIINRFKKVENFCFQSMNKALHTIKKSNILIVVIDSFFGMNYQDLNLIKFLIRFKKNFLLVFNKFDILKVKERLIFINSVKIKLRYLKYIYFHFISAKFGIGINHLFYLLEKINALSNKKYFDITLNQIFNKIILKHNFFFFYGKKVKFYYSCFSSNNPLIIKIYTNKIIIPRSYKSYLLNNFVKSFNLMGILTLIRFEVI